MRRVRSSPATAGLPAGGLPPGRQRPKFLPPTPSGGTLSETHAGIVATAQGALSSLPLQKGEKKRKTTKATEEPSLGKRLARSIGLVRAMVPSVATGRLSRPGREHGSRATDGGEPGETVPRVQARFTARLLPCPGRQRPDAYALKAGGTLGSELFGVALSHGRSDSLGKMRTAGISSRIKMSRLCGNPSRGTAKMSLNVHLLLPVGQLSTACS